MDDLQEVTIDDPNFLFEKNEGFQEVTSKRTLKIKQKLEAEQKKTEKEAQKKKEHQNKVISRWILLLFCALTVAGVWPGPIRKVQKINSVA